MSMAAFLLRRVSLVKTLNGKKYLVLGVANDHSIAWGITQKLHELGAQLCLTYPNEAIEKRVRPLATGIGCKLVFPCDVGSDRDLDGLFQNLTERWGALDGIVHAAAFADKRELESRFSDISRAGFHQAMEISAYSLIGMCGRAKNLLKKSQGSVLTLSYLGAERVVPNYGLMGMAKAALEAAVRYLANDFGVEGIRVNAISAGPVKTLASSGIPQFREMYAAFANKAPLKRHVTIEEIAEAAVFLLTPAAGGVTGEVMYVDCGYNVMGI